MRTLDDIAAEKARLTAEIERLYEEENRLCAQKFEEELPDNWPELLTQAVRESLTKMDYRRCTGSVVLNGTEILFELRPPE